VGNREGTVNIKGGVRAEVIELEEDFCSRNMQALRDRVEEALAKGGWHFVIDFSQAKSIDSAGLEMLLWAIEDIQEKGGLLKVCSLGRTMKKVFEITQFDRIFEVYEDVLSAVKSFP